MTAVTSKGAMATGHIAVHPDAIPDLIAQLVTLHLTRHPGESELLRKIVEAAIPAQSDLSNNEIDEIEAQPNPGPGF